jgi:hypothetical protein
MFRGNVQTRLRKLDEGDRRRHDARLAGLKRLGLAATDIATDAHAARDVPAGARAGRDLHRAAREHRGGRAALPAINDGRPETGAAALACERAFLAARSTVPAARRSPVLPLCDLAPLFPREGMLMCWPGWSSDIRLRKRALPICAARSGGLSSKARWRGPGVLSFQSRHTIRAASNIPTLS